MNNVCRKLIIGCLDAAIAVALVLGNYVYVYRMPRRLDSLNQQVEVRADTGESAAGNQPGEGAGGNGTGNRQGTGTEESRITEAQEMTWRDRFREYFTEEVQISDMTYSGPNVAVSVEKRSFGEGADTVTYYVADIHIADIGCLRTGFAQDTYGTGYREGLEEMSARFQAIAAISGDSYSNDSRMESGTIIRNGIVYRKETTESDVCVLYYDGRMQTFSPEEFDPEQVIADGAYQTWIFGPALLDENGKSRTDYNTWDYIRQAHPRTAIGYYEPGHYCMLLADGRQEEEQYSRGMYLEEMSAVFEEMGCLAAYNLDGGHCSMLTFNGAIANHPYELSKDICDCIYIAEPPQE